MRFSNQINKIITLRHNQYSIRNTVKGKTQIYSNEIIILVHGYNVSEEGAKQAYTKFRKNFSKYCYVSPKLKEAIYYFLWPSDKPNKLDSVLSYYKTVKTAQKCGEKLAEYLKLIAANNQQTRLILIGHSLGCRLLVEALHKLEKDKINLNVKKLDIFLMAAAVPVDKVKDKLPHSSHNKYHILYSGNDDVLKFTFPSGQQLAKEGLSEAVGLKGNPHSGVWNQRYETGYNHSDYWQGKESAEWIASQLGVLRTPSRKLKERRLQSRVIPKREIKIPSRSLSS